MASKPISANAALYDSFERPAGFVESEARPSRPLSTALTPLRRPWWLPESEWPFETFALDSDGSTIAVTQIGSGPTLLFVHTGFWSFVWRDVVLRLSQNFRCVFFDSPGTGQSQRLGVSDISLERAARALVNVAYALDLNDITLVFHDLGGPSGIAGASQLPSRIRGLCAVNTFAWKPTGAAFRGMLALIGSAAFREFDAVTNFLPKVTSTAFGAGKHMSESSRAVLNAGIGPQGARAFHSYIRDARKSRTIYPKLDLVLGETFRHLPLLTIFGERNDPFGFQQRWKSLYPDARQIVVYKGNHFPMCDAPDLVASSIREFHRERIAPGIASASTAAIA